ncbi:MAG: tyrosine decarboxylase MfnA [Candidatus Altiarchaeales archaeon ex4484_2]|nr:MAG: tyrosine decarboxylase MfnA [Candidatus Altiarchaeales archaeon ex4484_2]
MNDVLGRLMELRKKDPFFADGRILSSVCTEPSDVSLEAYRIFSDVNVLDRYVFPNSGELEMDVIKWFSSILGKKNLSGYVTSGGTEANIQALWAAKKKYPGRREILVPESAHYSLDKAADLLELEIKWIPLDEKFKADVASIQEGISDETLAVVLTAGTSALGVVDPITEVNGLCGDVFFHVDAAFAGMVLPFLENSERIDFGLVNIDSLTIDPHKMGYTPIPSGCILFRDESYMKRLRFKPSYLEEPLPTLTGSRSAGFIAAVWANLMFYGVEGFRSKVWECMENTRFLLSLLEGVEGVEPVIEPEINFVALTSDSMPQVYGLLLERGWALSLDRETNSIRIVVMPHVSREVLEDFVGDLRECMNSIP